MSTDDLHRSGRSADVHFNAGIATAVEDLRVTVELQESARLQFQLDAAAQLNAIEEKIQRIFDELAALRASQEKHGDELSMIHQYITRASPVIDGLLAAPYRSSEATLELFQIDEKQTLGFQSPTDDPPYLAFEKAFRGPEKMVRDRLQPYVDLLRAAPAVVDIGCGRGEMLDLLTLVGIPAVGVDIDENMVKHCREKGHTVLVQDAITWAASQKRATLGSCFSSQFIEHIDPSCLPGFLKSVQQALLPGGLLIAETPNPHSPSAFRAFWTDLSHQRPIYPETLLVLCQVAGFQSGYIYFPGGSGDYENDRVSRGEYAVVACA